MRFLPSYHFHRLPLRHFSRLRSRHGAFLHRAAEMGQGSITYQYNSMEQIGVITISNPRHSNAISGKMMVNWNSRNYSSVSNLIVLLSQVHLAEIMDELETQSKPLKALLVQGDTASASFCSGLDFEIISELNKSDLASAKNVFMTEVLHRFHQLPCVSFAIIHGPAVGGGAELVTACDFRIMAEDQSDAYIQFVHAKMGLTPGRLPT